MVEADCSDTVLKEILERGEKKEDAPQ